MFLGGLWHGAAWSYAIWGTIHGAALAIERPLLGLRLYQSNAPPALAARALMVFVFVSFAWLFFKFRDQADAFTYIIDIFRNTDVTAAPQDLGAACVYCLPVVAYHLFGLWRRKPLSDGQRNWLHAVMLLLIATNSGVPGAFIYFQF
jgi:alginate O-acetyltransferase complex protein AlgI